MSYSPHLPGLKQTKIIQVSGPATAPRTSPAPPCSLSPIQSHCFPAEGKTQGACSYPEPLHLLSLLVVSTPRLTTWSHLLLSPVSFLGAFTAVSLRVLTLAYWLAPNTREYCPSFYNYFWGLEVLSPRVLPPSHKPHETEVPLLGPLL